MLSSAVVFAICVTIASRDTLGAPFGTDVVRDCLGVLGGVGGDVVCTDAGVVEGVGVAVVLDGVGGVSGGLETDQRAGILLVGAPDISCGLRDGSDIDSVLRLGRSQLGNHGQEEKTETTHLVGFLLERRGRKTFGKGSDR